MAAESVRLPAMKALLRSWKERHALQGSISVTDLGTACRHVPQEQSPLKKGRHRHTTRCGTAGKAGRRAKEAEAGDRTVKVEEPGAGSSAGQKLAGADQAGSAAGTVFSGSKASDRRRLYGICLQRVFPYLCRRAYDPDRLSQA